MTNEKFNSIPAGACFCNVGDFTIGNNGANAKTAPIKLRARSGDAIEHWFWGRVIHDLAGMQLHKSRVPIDYAHDTKEVVGYLNKFDSESGNLETSGALVPFKDNDRATEIIYKLQNGVPYEASINFGGDGIKVQELAEGEVAEVNGRIFEGPGTIVRQWPLRGVAICPYGADANTDSSMFGNNNKVFTASVIEPETAKQEDAMSNASVENAAAEQAEAVKNEAQKNAVEVELQAIEAKPEKTAQAVVDAGGKAVEDARVVEMEAKPEAKTELSRDEFVRIADKFGSEIAVKVVRDGGDYVSAMEMAYQSKCEENEKLVKELAVKNERTNGTPVVMTDAKPKSGLFKTEKK